MDRVDEGRRTRIEGGAEDSPPTGRTVISRRAVLGGAAGGALVTLLARPELAWAQGSEQATLVVLLRGLYQPVVDGPDLGLSGVDLNDGSYSTTKIYPVSGFRIGRTSSYRAATSTSSSKAAWLPTTCPAVRSR